jgi:hypothetical protein
MIAAGFLMMIFGLMLYVLFATEPGPLDAISAVFMFGGSAVLMAGVALWAWEALS